VDIEEFARIQLALPDHLKMQIFLCRRDNQVLNALVVTHIGDMPIYLLGATSDEGMKSKGAYLLQWRAMQWLKERGAAWYDLGGINPETNPGVYEFKKGFSGQEAHYFGCFECSGSGVSSALVRAGEYLALRHSNGKAKSAVKTND
jgi:lipid II:glycine glycyltransferase (peptidoglycan interpeptide bridge formation enzyme)